MSPFEPRAYWEARLGKTYSLGGVGFQGLGVPYNEWLYRVRRQLFNKYVSPLVADKVCDVLDVGSGTGFYIERWREAGAASICGADITDAAVEPLRKRYPAMTFSRVDIGGEAEQLPPGAFDVVSIMDVLFHIVDDARYERAFVNLASLIKPGGYLVFTDNFRHGETMREAHIVHRSLRVTEEVLQKAGLQTVLRRPLFVLMNGPHDSTNPLHHTYWRWLTRLLRRSNVLGHPIGAGLYPLEVALCNALHEGPSTELMICRKPA